MECQETYWMFGCHVNDREGAQGQPLAQVRQVMQDGGSEIRANGRCRILTLEPHNGPSKQKDEHLGVKGERFVGQ